jgi:hypothetical protein
MPFDPTTANIFTSEPFPPSATVVKSPFGPAQAFTSLPQQFGSLIDMSGCKFTSDPARANKLQSILNLRAYQVEPYEEEWSEDDSTAVIHWRVPWINNPGFLAWARGYSYNAAGRMNRIPPAQHPKFPWLYCVNAKLVKGDGAAWIDTDPALIGDGTDPTFVPQEMIAFYDNGSGIPGVFAGTGSALWRLTYRQLPYAILTDSEMLTNGVGEEYHRFTERIETYAIEQLAIPGKQFVFIEGPAGINGQPIDQSGTLKRFATRAIIYRWHDVPDVPEDGLNACVGTVNVTIFDQEWTSPNGLPVGGGLPGGYPPETLYCEAPKKERKRNAVGRVTWTMEYTLLYRPSGWNKFPGQDGEFYRAAFPGNKPLFKSSEFRQLFQMPAASRLYQNEQF